MKKNEVILSIKYGKNDKLEDLFGTIKEKGYEMEIIEYKNRFNFFSFIKNIWNKIKKTYNKYNIEIGGVIFVVVFIVVVGLLGQSLFKYLSESQRKSDDEYKQYLKTTIEKNITIGVSKDCLIKYKKPANELIRNIYKDRYSDIGSSPKKDKEIELEINKSLNELCEGFVNE